MDLRNLFWFSCGLLSDLQSMYIHALCPFNYLGRLLQGKDMNELKRHIYSNTIDRSGIKKLMRDVFPPCRCREAQQLRNHQVTSNTFRLGTHVRPDTELNTACVCTVGYEMGGHYSSRVARLF